MRRGLDHNIVCTLDMPRAGTGELIAHIIHRWAENELTLNAVKRNRYDFTK